MQLIFNVAKQIISLENADMKVVAKSRNYLCCKFCFCDDWSEATKTAVFVSATGETYNVILENDACVVPWEVIEHPHFTVSVFGGDRITANKVIVKVMKCGYCEGKTSKPPTPDIYEQILNSVKPPYIGENGNWFVWSTENKEFIDSGIAAAGYTPQKGIDYFTEQDIEEINKYIAAQIALIKTEIGDRSQLIDSPDDDLVTAINRAWDNAEYVRNMVIALDKDVSTLRGEIGNIGTALDNIIAIQNTLIGGDSE